jgi:hypothetical protein
MEKYVFAQKTLFLTYLCIFFGLLIPIVRIFEMNSYSWFGQQVLEIGNDDGVTTSLGFAFTFFWLFLIVILFLIILLLMQLYIRMGTKAPAGSKLRSKSRLVVIGLVFYVAAILTTQNAARELMNVNCADPVWGCMTYVFGFSTPIALFITLICLRKGFNRDF